MRNDFNYQTIVDAKAGNEDAIETIIAYFDHYLVSMSYTPQYIGQGKVQLRFDEDLYMCLKIRLRHSIEKTNIA